MRNHIKELIIVTAIAGLFASPAIAQERPGQNPEVERPGGGGGRPAPYNPGGGRGTGGNPGHGGGNPSPRPHNPAPTPHPKNPAPAPSPRPTNPTPPTHNGGGQHHGGSPATSPRPNNPPQNHAGNGGGIPSHGGGWPSNPGAHHRSDDDIRHNRDQVSHERQGDAGEMARRRADMQRARDSWHNSYHVNINRDVNAIHNAARWADRLTRWETGCVRPPSRYFNNIRWIYPMPPETSWSYAQLDVVSSDLESLSRDIYTQMAKAAYINPNREYSARLMNVLGQLVDAAENYDDAIDNSYDWSDSLDDLFYLDNTLTMVEQTLNGYSQAYLVQNQLEALRYYVNQLLWTYHQNY
ncbi:MAG TPA: hypothetical protein VF412_05920 [Bdellovibrio sp.]|uniref:hypothetical protein n=1 Tax=Bdellovibrio sp. TaxID=28201 RepID=UPI002EEDBDF1